MTKRKVEEFIAANIQKYGLTGSNTAHNEPKFQKLHGGSPLYFSKNNHFIWGYSGHSYHSRRSSTCMYFTDYLKQKSTGSVLSLDRSLVDIAGQLVDQYAAWDAVYVVNRGRFEDYAVIEACKNAETMFHQLVVKYEGESPYHAIPYDSAVPHSSFYVTSDMLLELAQVVVPWLRTKSLDTILDIAISRGMGYDESLIYPTRMKFVNHNHDGKQSCGPANWALCDAEEDTALMRYSWYESHTNISNLTANVATWSPELIASQLDHPELRECMTGNGANADLATENMWKSLSPKNYECTDRPSWWEEVQEEINEIHDNGKYNEKWYTPLHRLLDRVGVSYSLEVTDESYGTVS